MLVDNAPGHCDFNQSSINKIIFFDPNLTTHIQPLDQGIIQNFRNHYRQFLLEHIIKCLDEDKSNKINIATVIKWSFDAWNSVLQSTIISCWNKSKLICVEKKSICNNIEGINSNYILENEKFYSKELLEAAIEFQKIESALPTS